MGRGAGFESGVARARGCRMCLGLSRCWAFENLSPPALESPERKDAFLSSCCVVQMLGRKGWMGVAWFLSSCCYYSLLCVCVCRCRKIWIFMYRVQRGGLRRFAKGRGKAGLLSEIHLSLPADLPAHPFPSSLRTLTFLSLTQKFIVHLPSSRNGKSSPMSKL